MTEDGVANNIDGILEAGYCQSHHLTKDNVENKQMDEIEELPETGNYNNPVIGLYQRRYFYNIYLYRKSNIPGRKVLSEPQYRLV